MFADLWVAPKSYGDDCVLLLLISVITFSELSRVLLFLSLVDATVVLADGVPLYDFLQICSPYLHFSKQVILPKAVLADSQFGKPLLCHSCSSHFTVLSFGSETK